MENLLVSLFVVFIFITFIPLIARLIKAPVIVIEIVFWIILWKSFLNIIPLDNEIIQFFREFWLIYLMFLWGLEICFVSIKKYFKQTVAIAFFSLIIPFLTWVWLWYYSWIHPLILWTILSTTSLWLVFSLVKEFELDKKLANIVLWSVVLVDIFSMFILAFSLTYIGWNLRINFIYSLLAVLTLFFIPYFASKLQYQKFIWSFLTRKIRWDMEVRFSFALIFILTAVSWILWFHAIMGAFIAWLIVTQIRVPWEHLERRLESFGYWFFIPLFFIFTWASVDLFSIFSNFTNLFLLAILVLLWIISKIIWTFTISRIKLKNQSWSDYCIRQDWVLL